MPKDVSEQFESARNEFFKKRAELEAQWKKTEEDLTKKVIDGFNQKFDDAVCMLEGLPPQHRREVLKTPAVKNFMRLLSLQTVQTQNKIKGKPRNPKISEAEILEFLGTGKRIAETRAHFGWKSDPTFYNHVNPLIEAGKVKKTDTRPTIYQAV